MLQKNENLKFKYGSQDDSQYGYSKLLIGYN